MSNHLYDALFRPHAESAAPLFFLPDGRVVSYREFLQMGGRIAHLFETIGVTKGDRVAVQVAKSVEALAIYAACIQIGAAILPLNTAYTAEEVAYFVGDASPALLICAPEAEATLRDIAIRNGAALRTLDASGGGTLLNEAGPMQGLLGASPCGADDIAAILYTSGTTGKSKGAMLTHQNLLSNAEVLVELWRFSKEDVLLHALPIFHIHGLFVAVNTCVRAGAAMLYHDGFNLDAILTDLTRATVMMGVPTFYTRLLQSPRLDANLTGTVRLFVSGSAPLLAETHAQFQTATGHVILERYGMTETNMNSSNPYDGERRPGTVGFPLAGVEIVITDPASGTPLPTGEVGMIEVRGRNVFKGYWRNPEKTAEDLRLSGFFVTGDLGRFDAEGYLHIVGRQKDLIISGGYNIYPKEIEGVIDEEAGVIESAVFGIPDADFGEAVVAVVVVDPSAGLTPDGLLNAIRPRLARFKHPKQICFVEGLPRNTMGKVQKAVLRQTYAS